MVRTRPVIAQTVTYVLTLALCVYMNTCLDARTHTHTHTYTHTHLHTYKQTVQVYMSIMQYADYNIMGFDLCNSVFIATGNYGMITV